MSTMESGLRPRLPWRLTELAARAAKFAALSDGYQGAYTFSRSFGIGVFVSEKFDGLTYRGWRLSDVLCVESTVMTCYEVELLDGRSNCGNRRRSVGSRLR